MAVKLTDKVVKGAASPDAGNAITWDSEIPGFGLRTTAAGVKAFVINYRASGIERRKTIGQYPAWSVAAARVEAAELRQRIDRGEDPLAAERQERGEPTVRELAERYIEEWLPRKRPSGQARDKAMIAADILPVLGKVKVKAVTYADVNDLHRRVSKRAPIRANRVLACASKMFGLAATVWGYRTDNPCKGIERNAETQRERFLSPEEISRLVVALKAYPGRAAADCLLFLLLTGARSGEAMGATWGQIDLAAGTWTKSSSHTKQAKLHHVPLNAPALQLLASIRPADARSVDYVFPGRRRGEPLKQLRWAWENVTETAGVTGARIHDIRHSFASVLASSGSSLALIGRMLGHSSPRTTARYSHFFVDPLREAAERVGSIVIAEGTGAEVVPLVPGKKA
jgi:integrase